MLAASFGPAPYLLKEVCSQRCRTENANMIRFNSNDLDADSIREHTSVRMGAVAIVTECGKCGKRTVGIILTSRPGYYAMECKNCGTSAEVETCDLRQVSPGANAR